eukprot:TRINITY_DN22186_c0_g1_i1.p2 TRINITY_DN22186_c0_g1~~TRINITY_DN22186_c0_g1_i1.p2  ORF type:complete len:232 (+),score=109.85 TRINITY_DN22186_c0_g1_i1:64-696(+)
MAPHAVPVAAVVSDWKDERVIVPDDDLDAMCGGLTALINALEGGEGVAEAKAKAAESWAVMEELDYGKAALVEARMEGYENALEARKAATDAEFAKVAEELAGLEPRLAAETALWEEVAGLPALLKKHSERADFALLDARVEKARKENHSAEQLHAQSKAQAEELRASYHLLLHKLSHLSSAAERLSASDNKRRRDDAPSAQPPAKHMKI